MPSLFSIPIAQAIGRVSDGGLPLLIENDGVPMIVRRRFDGEVRGCIAVALRDGKIFGLALDAVAFDGLKCEPDGSAESVWTDICPGPEGIGVGENSPLQLRHADLRWMFSSR